MADQAEIVAAENAFWAALGGEVPPCRADPDLWFPTPGRTDEAKLAKSVCRDLCPAREECLVWALTAGEKEGIWGGVSSPARPRPPKKSKVRD